MTCIEARSLSRFKLAMPSTGAATSATYSSVFERACIAIDYGKGRFKSKIHGNFGQYRKNRAFVSAAATEYQSAANLFHTQA